LPAESRLRRARDIFLITTALGLLMFAYRYLDFASRATEVPFALPLVEQLTGFWAAGLLFPFVARIARIWPLDRKGWVKRLPVHLLALITFSAVHTCIMWASRSVVVPAIGLGPYDYGIMPVRFLMEFFIDVIGYSVMIAFVAFSDRRTRTAELEATLSEARLHNLRLQLQPHFLFNALNTISTLMYEDPQTADRMMSSLCDLLRATLAESHAQEVPLEQELKFLGLYLNVMKLRFEDHLEVSMRIEPGAEHAFVPQLLLQPLVENAIRYGRDPATAKVRVALAARRAGELLEIEVRDHGRGVEVWPPQEGVGLRNTGSRLAQLYGSAHRFAFNNCSDGGFAVSVALPFRALPD
jgi:two-component system LytT family sensor kinase